MELKIDVQTGESCGFNIKDITGVSDTGYQDEFDESFKLNQFKYSDTISIAVMTVLKSDNSINQESPIFIKHDQYDYIHIPVFDDGHYQLNYIVIPTKIWADEHKESYDIIYYSDGESIYKNIKDSGEEIVPIEELIRLNADSNKTVSKIKEDYLSICFLKKCYIDICKKIFDLRGFTKCEYSGEVDTQLQYKRDLLWMSINTISYLAEFGQIEEAQRIIELIHGCNGICKSRNREIDHNGCGCS